MRALLALLLTGCFAISGDATVDSGEPRMAIMAGNEELKPSEGGILMRPSGELYISDSGKVYYSTPEGGGARDMMQLGIRIGINAAMREAAKSMKEFCARPGIRCLPAAKSR